MYFPNGDPFSAELLADFMNSDFPEQGQQSVAVEDATEPPAPTNSTAVAPPEQSSNPLAGINVNGEWQETKRRGPSLTLFVHVVNSSYADYDQTNNGSSSNVRGLIEEKTEKHMRLSEALTVPDTTSIYEAWRQMTDQRADVLVLTDSSGLITGIWTKKDVATRVISGEIYQLNTPVSKVMTKYPLPDTLVVQAVNSMVQGKFRQLPVIENDEVIGIVQVPLFDETQTMEMTAETYDKVLEAAGKRVAKRGLTGKQLPPYYYTCVPETTTIFAACCEMAATGVDAVVLTGSHVLFSGILTTKDVVSRVISCGVDVVNTPVSKVMIKKLIYVPYDTLPMAVLKNIVQGDGTQLLVREIDEDNGFVNVPLSIKDHVLRTRSKMPFDLKDPLTAKLLADFMGSCSDIPEEGQQSVAGEDATGPPAQTNSTAVGPLEQSSKPLSSVNGNSQWDETYGPGFTPFMRVNNSPYPNDYSDKLVAPPPQHTALGPPEQSSNPLLGMNANDPWHGTHGPGFTPLMHVTNSPYLNSSSDNLIAPPPQHTTLGPPKQSRNPTGNHAWDGTAGPGFTPFRHLTNSPYPNDPSGKVVAPRPQHTDVRPHKQSTNPLLGVKDNVPWDGTAGPGFTPFTRVTDSPYHNDSSDDLAAPPPQNTALGPSEQSSNPLPSVNGNHTWDGTAGPGFTPFGHVANSPYTNDSFDKVVAKPPQYTAVQPQEQSTNPLLGVNDNGDDQTNNGSSTNIRGSIEKTTVKQLSLSEALTLPQTTTIYEACCQMTAHNADVLVVTDSNALLTGILTNEDIVKRGIAREIDLVNTPVSKVMSTDPSYVMSDILVVDAVQKMMHREGVTQLPVIENGKVIGLFGKMEKKATATANHDKFIEAAVQKITPRGLKAKQLHRQHALAVPETTSIFEACNQMTDENVEYAVVTDSNALLKGILAVKDILSRIFPSGIDVENTPVSKVMKTNTIFVSCDTFPVETMLDIMECAGEHIQLLAMENGEDNGLLNLSVHLSDSYLPA